MLAVPSTGAGCPLSPPALPSPSSSKPPAHPQRLDGGRVLVDDHVQLKVVVLGAEQRLLVLVLAVVLRAGRREGLVLRGGKGSRTGQQEGAGVPTSRRALPKHTCPKNAQALRCPP